MPTWSAEELHAFLEHVADDPYAALWRLAATTGMRRGELVALRWRDVDFDAARVTVVQQLAKGGGTVTAGPTKTRRSRRLISLDPGTVEALRQHRKQQLGGRLAIGGAYEDHGLVFCRPDGHALHPDRLTQMFRQHCKAAGLPYVRLQGLRHTHATLMLRAGAPQGRPGTARAQLDRDHPRHLQPRDPGHAGGRGRTGGGTRRRAGTGAGRGAAVRASGRIARGSRDHSVISAGSRTGPPLGKSPLTCGFSVGTPGFEPGISGPPDQRPGPSWATSRGGSEPRTAGYRRRPVPASGRRGYAPAVAGEGAVVRLFDAGAREGGDEVVHDRVLTVPNAITLVRLLGLPLFAWLLLGAERPAAAFWTLAAVASTDWLDGYVARRFDQVSRIGKLIAPLVDRVVLATAAVALAVAGVLHWGVLVAIVVRDVAVLVGALALFGKLQPMPVTPLGKLSTACLLAGLPAFLVAAIDWAAAGVSGVLAVTLTGVGLAAYYAAALHYAWLASALRRGDRPS
jgi:cardiolipin synthase (CMP-forming)